MSGATWVLVFWLILADGNIPQIQMPGYKSKEDCQAAGIAAQKNLVLQGETDVGDRALAFTCLPDGR
jgi:hypothetical protein